MFQKATKKAARLRLALEGTAGTGKTFSALQIAQIILDKGAKAQGNGRIALIDTEHGSASLYSDKFDFDACELDEFSLKTYMEKIEGAKQAGYPILLIDSMSHAWTGKGGALEQVDRAAGSKFTNGWKTVSPLQNQFINTILAYPGHVIATLRTKMEYVIEKNEHTGKSEPKKVGLAPIQRDGVDYEFSVVLDLQPGGNLSVTKSRCSTIAPGANLKWEDVPATAERLMAWLADGAGRTPLDDLSDDIRSVRTREALMAIVPRLNALTDPEKATLRPLFAARLEEFPE